MEAARHAVFCAQEQSSAIKTGYAATELDA
jgi:hypothetical protein